jgi:hypothetical protein
MPIALLGGIVIEQSQSDKHFNSDTNVQAIKTLSINPLRLLLLCFFITFFSIDISITPRTTCNL